MQKSLRMRKWDAPARTNPKPMSQKDFVHDSKKPGALRFKAGKATSVTVAVPSPRAKKMEKKIAAWTGSGRILTPLGAAEITASAKLVLGIDDITVRRKDMVLAAVRAATRPADTEESP